MFVLSDPLAAKTVVWCCSGAGDRVTIVVGPTGRQDRAQSANFVFARATQSGGGGVCQGNV